MAFNMNISIEKATTEQFEEACQLLKQLYGELGEEESSVTFLNIQLLTELTQNGKTEIYFARLENHGNIGIITLTEGQAIYAGGKYGILDEMYVLPGYRSNKVGAEFIKKIKEVGREKGWNRIDVTAPTEERWHRTRFFYEKSGFKFTGPKLKLYLNPDHNT